MAALPSSPGTAQWSSRFAFIMAAVGSSVGLGNLWRFSAEAGENGGGAFIFVYLACVVFIGIPVLMSEYIVGRAGNASSAIISVEDVAERSGVSKGWASFAWVGTIGAFLIVSFYCVVAAWVLMYIPKFLTGAFSGMDPAQIASVFDAEAIGPQGGFSGHGTVMFWFTVFVIFTAFLVSRGVNKGIEATAKILMPVFFLLLIGLSLYSLISGFGTPITTESGEATNGGAAALAFLFSPDWSALNFKTFSDALGQAFFSIGIGSAIMITYGSYLPRDVNIPQSAILVALTDTLVAIIAGLAVFPIVFSHGLDVNSGAGLFFKTLPVALSSVPGGNIVGAAFFFLAFFAAITSSISLFEPAVAYVAEKFELTRAKSALIMGVIMWIIGASCVMSIKMLTFLDEGLTGPVMLPLSGLLLVLFVGWRLKRAMYIHETLGVPSWLVNLLYFLIRFVAPISVAVILVMSVLGLPEVYAGIFGG